MNNTATWVGSIATVVAAIIALLQYLDVPSDVSDPANGSKEKIPSSTPSPKMKNSLSGFLDVSEILIQSSTPTWLQISEVIAIDASTGKDLALQSKGAEVMVSSLYSGSEEKYVIDGYGPSPFPKIFHSGAPDSSQFLRVTLKKQAKLKSITIMGRVDSFSSRDIYNLTLFNDKNEKILERKDLSAISEDHAVTIELND